MPPNCSATTSLTAAGCPRRDLFLKVRNDLGEANPWISKLHASAVALCGGRSRVAAVVVVVVVAVVVVGVVVESIVHVINTVMTAYDSAASQDTTDHKHHNHSHNHLGNRHRERSFALENASCHWHCRSA